jgi:uncharacterized iron-regulated membrane protein
MKQKRSRSSWQKVRKLFNDIHLWVGLASGILVFVICLTGTIYVYNTEIRELAHPELHFVRPQAGAQKLSFEEIITRVSGEIEGKVISIKVPNDTRRSYVLTVQKTAPTAPVKGTEVRSGVQRGSAGAPAARPQRGVQYMVDPYTGSILGSSADKTAVAEFMGYMFSLHRWLLLDKIEKPLIGDLPNRTLGSYISGTATILFTLGVITGMIIWFPRKVKNWRQGLKIKWSAGWKRVNHDLHSSLGLYSCILLFLMGITGPQWSFPWYREALRKTLGTHVAADAPRPETPGSDPANADSLRGQPYISHYLQAADHKLTYKGDYTVTLPADSMAAVAVSKTRVGFFAPLAGDKLLLDQYNAEVIQTEIFRDKPVNERISNSIKAIHVGDVYGGFSKLLYFLACLIATSLPVTGTLIWINKLKKKS